MKKKSYLLFLVVCTFLFSCRRDIDFKVKNPVSGTIAGKEWNYKSGVFMEAELFGFKSFSINITDYVGNEICDVDYLKLVNIMVSMPELKVGKYALEDLRNLDEDADIAIRHPDHVKGILADPGWSCESGYIEIRFVDNSKNIIEGYIEAYVDEDYNVSGNFKAVRCEL